jgi:uncharacterized protein YqgV (UPF0045/DUF77 family)
MTTKRALRSTPERDADIALAIKLLASSSAKAITDAMETCLSCEHFDEATEVCALAQARPPARVIAHGCPSYSAQVPF